MCPWHAWAFDVTTGVVRAPDTGRVAVYAVRVEGEDVLVEVGERDSREWTVDS
jgi:nitrite reductase/ring-hydroxylating ferredoxin subunit